MFPAESGSSNLRKFSQANSFSERIKNAESGAELFNRPFPVLVNAGDSRSLSEYGGWSIRLVVDAMDGRIAWESGQGPRGFQPRKLESWLRKKVAR